MLFNPQCPVTASHVHSPCDDVENNTRKKKAPLARRRRHHVTAFFVLRASSSILLLLHSLGCHAWVDHKALYSYKAALWQSQNKAYQPQQQQPMESRMRYANDQAPILAPKSSSVLPNPLFGRTTTTATTTTTTSSTTTMTTTTVAAISMMRLQRRQQQRQQNDNLSVDDDSYTLPSAFLKSPPRPRRQRGIDSTPLSNLELITASASTSHARRSTTTTTRRNNNHHRQIAGKKNNFQLQSTTLLDDETDMETDSDNEEEEIPDLQTKKRNPASNIVPDRQRHSLGKAIMLSRHVPLSRTWSICVWEWEKPSAVIETYWQVEQQGLDLTPDNRMLDPFGLVLWPGAVVAAQEMMEHRDVIQDKRVLVLGAGVGVESIAAAQLGARRVMATDVHPTTLKLLQYGAQHAGPDVASKIESQLLDITATQEGTTSTAGQQQNYQPLPDCDVLIAADVLYNHKLSWHVMERIVEARRRNPNCVVLLSDSQRFISDFDVVLSNKLMQLQDEQEKQNNKNNGETQPKQKTKLQWQSRWLPQFTGSGIFVDQDQTYEAKARILWIGKD